VLNQGNSYQDFEVQWVLDNEQTDPASHSPSDPNAPGSCSVAMQVDEWGNPSLES